MINNGIMNSYSMTHFSMEHTAFAFQVKIWFQNRRMKWKRSRKAFQEAKANQNSNNGTAGGNSSKTSTSSEKGNNSNDSTSAPGDCGGGNQQLASKPSTNRAPQHGSPVSAGQRETFGPQHDTQLTNNNSMQRHNFAMDLKTHHHLSPNHRHRETTRASPGPGSDSDHYHHRTQQCHLNSASVKSSARLVMTRGVKDEEMEDNCSVDDNEIDVDDPIEEENKKSSSSPSMTAFAAAAAAGLIPVTSLLQIQHHQQQHHTTSVAAAAAINHVHQQQQIQLLHRLHQQHEDMVLTNQQQSGQHQQVDYQNENTLSFALSFQYSQMQQISLQNSKHGNRNPSYIYSICLVQTEEVYSLDSNHLSFDQMFDMRHFFKTFNKRLCMHEVTINNATICCTRGKMHLNLS
jgi:hypothetical protein